MNQLPANLNYVVANAYTSSSPEVFQARAPGVSDIQYPIQQRWFNTAANQEYILIGFTSLGGLLQANWKAISTGGNIIQISVPPGSVSPIQPDVTGTITFTSNDNTVTITGSSANPNNNFIDFSASGSAVNAIKNIITDTGAGTPLTGNTINLNSAAPFATSTGPNSIRVTATDSTHGLIALQKAGSNAASSTANNFGIVQFDANQFNVMGGFVKLIGGNTPPTLGIHPNATSGAGTDPTIPDVSGNISILGSSVSAGTNPIRTVATAANSLTTQVQISQAIVASDATKIGLSNYNSAQFTVDANGFVSLAGGTTPAIEKIGVQTGTTTIQPTASKINVNGATVVAGTNPVRTDGTASDTFAVEVQISQSLAATDATKIGLSNFSNAQFSVDANGFVQLKGGTTSAIKSVVRQVFTVSGTYTPTTNMVYCDIQCVGGGGGGGGVAASTTSAAGGGGGGEYRQGIFSAASIGASKTVTIGAGGTAGAIGGNGGIGGTTSVGVLISSIGGNGGEGDSQSTIKAGGTGGIGGSGGDFSNIGSCGFPGAINGNVISGPGGSTFFGGGGTNAKAGSNSNVFGNFGRIGGGGSGAGNNGNASGNTGGAGGPGIVVITEYVT